MEIAKLIFHQKKRKVNSRAIRGKIHLQLGNSSVSTTDGQTLKKIISCTMGIHVFQILLYRDLPANQFYENSVTGECKRIKWYPCYLHLLWDWWVLQCVFFAERSLSPILHPNKNFLLLPLSLEFEPLSLFVFGVPWEG